VLPLIAASTPEQLRENLDALKLELSAGQLERLSNARA
jgi:aryl-alcohol dehydrogenase-like predicted oxidoreductase